MNAIIPFSFESNQIRVITGDDGEPWFVAADILSVLALDRKALERLDDDEKGVSSIHTPGGEQDMTIVNEPGLYGLVLGSRKPAARREKVLSIPQRVAAMSPRNTRAIGAYCAVLIARGSIARPYRESRNRAIARDTLFLFPGENPRNARAIVAQSRNRQFLGRFRLGEGSALEGETCAVWWGLASHLCDRYKGAAWAR